MHTGVKQLPWPRTQGTAGALENSTMKMHNIFIPLSCAGTVWVGSGLGVAACSGGEEIAKVLAPGAPAFVQLELRNRKPKPLITALFSAPATPVIVCLLFSVTQESQDKSRQRCTMSQ